MGNMGLDKQDRLKSADHDVEVNVAVEGDRIIVTRPGTSFRAAYFKSPDQPKLIESAALAVDKGGPIARKEFEDLAWDAANAKARELGWVS